MDVLEVKEWNPIPGVIFQLCTFPHVSFVLLLSCDPDFKTFSNFSSSINFSLTQFTKVTVNY